MGYINKYFLENRVVEVSIKYYDERIKNAEKKISLKKKIVQQVKISLIRAETELEEDVLSLEAEKEARDTFIQSEEDKERQRTTILVPITETVVALCNTYHWHFLILF